MREYSYPAKPCGRYRHEWVLQYHYCGFNLFHSDGCVRLQRNIPEIVQRPRADVDIPDVASNKADATCDGFLDGCGASGIQADDVSGDVLEAGELCLPDDSTLIQKDDSADFRSRSIGIDARGSAGGLYLRLNLGLDFCKGNGTEVVVVNTYIVLEREEHLQARVIQTRVAGRTAMNVTEELPDIPIGTSVTEEWIVVEDDGLAAHADGHLLDDMFEFTHVPLAEAFHVVVAQDEVFVAWQCAENVIPEVRTAVSEVSKVENNTVARYGLPPASNEFGIHLFRILERPVAESDDVLVTEVGVRCEPDVIGLEFED